MRTLLVTGAGGYIGSVLTRLALEEGMRVRVVDRLFFGRETLPPEGERLRVVEADIRSFEPALLDGVAAVIDLAALSNDPSGELDPAATWAINFEGRARVARLAKARGVGRYLLPSSCSVYGFQDGLLDETSPARPLTTYAQANLRAEEAALALADASFAVTVLRQATVYGRSPRMRFDLAINGMVKGLYQRRRIPVLRDGTQWRPFVHVGDAARALLAVLEAPAAAVSGQIFNVGSDAQNFQILPLARAVAAAAGVPFAHDWYGDADRRSYRVSFAKIERVLGWRAERRPEDGAREVLAALATGALDPEDPRTITVGWYRHLLAAGLAL